MRCSGLVNAGEEPVGNGNRGQKDSSLLGAGPLLLNESLPVNASHHA